MRNVRLLVNPYAKYLTSIDLPGLRVTGGQEYHYPWVDPEAPAPVSVATASQGLAPGWSILPGYVVGEKGKGSGMRQQVFKLLYQGRDSGKFALTAVAAAELSHKLDPATMQRRKPTWWKAQANPVMGECPSCGEETAGPGGPFCLEEHGSGMRDTGGRRPTQSEMAQVWERVKNKKRSNAELRALAAQGDSRAAEELENNEMAYQEWQSRQAQENPRTFQKGKGKFKQTAQSVEEQWKHFMDVGELWHEAGPDDGRAGSSAFAARFPSPTKRYQATKNPVWVTPAGSAVRHTDAGWAAYQAKHKGVRLPAQAAREADLEAQTRVLAPGWSVRESQKRKSGGEPYTAYCLYFNGQDTGKYALDVRKAVEISWRTDPETGKRKGK